MKHTASEITVYKTKDYSRFEFIEGNRGLNHNKIKNIIAEIEAGNDVLKYNPILVEKNGNKLRVPDGQHRFFISKKLGRYVYYIIMDEKKTMAEIARVNSNVEKWSQKDFINCYITQGNKHYKKLKEFIDLYKINVGTSLRLLTFGQPGTEGSNTELTKQFENGMFEVKTWDQAAAIADNVKKFQSFPFHTDRGFVIAIYKIIKADLITIDTLLDAYNKNPDKLEKQASYKQYLYNLEQLVNVGKQKRIVIT